MSADLLRRAAAKLREHAEAAPEGPWVSLDNGDRLIALRPDSTFDKGFRYLVDEPIADSSTAEYFALMHPPVALALAAWLEQEARHAADAVAAWSRDTSYIDAHLGGVEAHTEAMYALPFQVARAILREPKDGAA